MTRALLVEETGPLLTVQDLGRPGLASLGVPESGALDPAALRLANRLVGNDEGAPALEATLGGLVLRARGQLVLALTGAPVPVSVDGRAHGTGEAVHVRDGARVELGRPRAGLRTYLAVRGGLDVPLLLGSASTDLLSGLGRPLDRGEELAVGTEPARPVPVLDVAPAARAVGRTIHLRAVPGPREEWFTAEALRLLTTTEWTVDPRSNRVGVRLTGATLDRAVEGELASEGVVAGALQVPGNGTPVLFLADHPVTGGYPVIAVVVAEDLPAAAQAAPGQLLRVHLVARPDLTAGFAVP